MVTATLNPTDTGAVTVSPKTLTLTGDFLPASAEGAHNVMLEADETSLSYTLATVTDIVDERSGSVAIALIDGRDYSFGWALEPLDEDAPDLSVGLRFNRRESATMEPQHTLGLELRASW